MDAELCYRAVSGRDSRFDGVFVVAVLTTGIYCRPSCPAVTPKEANVRFLRTAAAAQGAGFRACKRCRPDATPGSPEWNLRADLVGRAMRLIADGEVDRNGVVGLASRLGYSERQVHRQLVAEVGAGPLALARAQRAQAARTLLETTPLPVSEVAFAAGFASIRQFNDTVREVFAQTPTQLRAGAQHRQDGAAPAGVIALRLPFRTPYAPEPLLAYLAERAVPCLEEVDGQVYRRALRLPHGTGVVELDTDRPDRGWVACRLHLSDLRDLGTAVARSRRLLDLDSDPVAVDGHLGLDPVLGPLVAARPGLRVPGHVDPAELAVRAVLGEQVGQAPVLADLVSRYGRRLPHRVGAVTCAFPTAAELAAGGGELAVGARRAGTLRALVEALAEGDLELDPGVERDRSCARLAALPGVGPRTVAYVRMRGLGDPDVFLPADPGALLGGSGAALARTAYGWRPWRSYGVAHLWTHTRDSAELVTTGS